MLRWWSECIIGALMVLRNVLTNKRVGPTVKYITRGVRGLFELFGALTSTLCVFNDVIERAALCRIFNPEYSEHCQST